MKTNSIHYGDIGFYTIAMHYGTITFKNFKIILINNGGGIFRILPGHKDSVLIPSLKLHCLTAEHLAKMYGFDYTIASDEQSLSKD
jgi:2-succinyl-5-enolpyruvyl-6-hydroxy-3-cyclohexene-1-carboxylate synthase